MSKITRRKFLGLTALALPAALGADSSAFETTTLRVTKLEHGPGLCRFVHFSDFHYKGDADYAAEVVRTINELAPNFVCFTGDLVEEARFAPAAFDFIRQINAPVYGNPGNHDFQSGVASADFDKAFAATGAVCTAVAAQMRGTVLNDVHVDRGGGIVRIGHPTGIFPVYVKLGPDDAVQEVSYSRTARRLMEGQAYVPCAALEAV